MEGRVKRTGLSLFLVTLTLLAIPLIAVKPANSLTVTWGTPQRLTRTLAFDFLPSIIQTQDRKVWMFWEYVDFFKPDPDIHYKTWDWTSWPGLSGNLSTGGSAEQTLPGSTTYQETGPRVVQMKNGTMFVSFSSDRSGNFDIYLKKYDPTNGWSTDYQLTNSPQREESSSMVAPRDGSLWVFYDRLDVSTGVQNLYYKRYIPATGWTVETSFTSDSAPVRNREASAFQMQDGRIWLFWSQVQDTGFNKVYLYYRIFDGTSWQSKQQFTNTNNQDRHPSLLQDSSGTIWMVWSREIPLPGNCSEEDLFYKYSVNNGSTWSTDTAIMNDQAISDCQNDIAPDDNGPALVQLRDFKIWLFWHSIRDTEGWWDLYYTSSNPFPVHDVAVDSISATPILLRMGAPATIHVAISNPGGYTETLQLTIKATNVTTITIATRTVTLQPGSSAGYALTWDTSTANPARYKITATLQAVAGESSSNQANNSLDAAAKVHLVPPGDVNYDGKVTIFDASAEGLAYGSHTGGPKWNPDADLDNNGRIDIMDAAMVAFWYGATS